MSGSNENNPHLMPIVIGDVVADTDTTIMVAKPPRKHCLKSAHLLNQADLAGDDTNHVVVKLQKVGGSIVYATYENKAAGGGLTNGIGKAMTVNLNIIPRDEDLELGITHPGSGQALTKAKVVLEWYPT